MIKKCKVTIQNESVVVAIYDDIAIQFPPIELISSHIYVEKSGNNYFVVSKDKYEKFLFSEKKKTTKKININDDKIKNDDVIK